MAKRGRPKKLAPLDKSIEMRKLREEAEQPVIEVIPNPPEVVEANVPALVDPQALIARAIDKNLPIEQMERLLAMRRELREEWARDQYFAALARFQRSCPIIGKNKGVNDKYGKHRYSYAPLDEIVEQVKELLDANGFSYSLATEQTADSVTAICNSHHISGHSESTKFTVPIDPDAYMNAAQKVASALTYATRYAFRNAFGIMTGDEDDDAQATSEPLQEPKPKEPENPELKTLRDELRRIYQEAHDWTMEMKAAELPLPYSAQEFGDMRRMALEAKDNVDGMKALAITWSEELEKRKKAVK